MRVLVYGGRDFTDKEYLYRYMDKIKRLVQIDAVIEGNANGADRMAGWWARDNGIDNIKFPADWKKYGNAAGPIRNQQMIAEGNPDIAIEFPGRKGTKDMHDRLEKAGIEIILAYE